MLASAAICGAFLVAPRLEPRSHRLEALALILMVVALLPARPRPGSPGLSPTRWVPALLLFFGHWVSLHELLARVAGNALAPRSLEVNAALALLLCAVSMLPHPAAPSTVVGAHATRAAFVLTGQAR